MQVQGNGISYVTIYTCTIPANTVALYHSIRLTAMLGESGTGQLTNAVFLNGALLLGGSGNPGKNQFPADYWNIMITNTGSTTGVVSGVTPFYNSAEPLVTTVATWNNVAGLSWASAQTLVLQVEGPNTSFGTGINFVVEAL
jgi:hypothetical protein